MLITCPTDDYVSRIITDYRIENGGHENRLRDRSFEVGGVRFEVRGLMPVEIQKPLTSNL
jgi:hypothetical protein